VIKFLKLFLQCHLSKFNTRPNDDLLKKHLCNLCLRCCFYGDHLSSIASKDPQRVSAKYDRISSSHLSFVEIEWRNEWNMRKANKNYWNGKQIEGSRALAMQVEDATGLLEESMISINKRQRRRMAFATNYCSALRFSRRWQWARLNYCTVA